MRRSAINVAVRRNAALAALSALMLLGARPAVAHTCSCMLNGEQGCGRVYEISP
jgi:hypothetical protein